MPEDCITSVFLWAVGPDKMVAPEEGGMLVGRGTDALHGVIQIHYDNPKAIPGIVGRCCHFPSNGLKIRMGRLM